MKTREYKGSIEKKLRKLVLLIVSMVFFIAYVAFAIFYIKEENIRAVKLNKTIQNVISQDLAKLIFLNNVATAADITTKLKSFDVLESLVVYKNGTKAVYQYAKNDKSFVSHHNTCKDGSVEIVGHTITMDTDISYFDKKIGCTSMTLRYVTYFDVFKKYIWHFSVLYLFVVLMTYLLSYYYAKKFTRPIIKLTKFLEQIELATSLDKRIEVTQNDEFGKLYEETNIMLEGLQKSLQEQQKTKEQLRYLQRYDSLTGFPNKDLFLKSLQTLIDTQTTKVWHLIFCIDISKFKILNEVYGHERSDIVLQKFAQRLEEEFEDVSLKAKIGVDEFLLYYRNVSDDEDVAIQKAEEVLNRLLGITSKPFLVKDKEIFISVHVGVDIHSNLVTNAAEIFKEVDSALQNAKKEEVYFSFYNKEVERKAQKSLDIYTELLSAVKEEQFELYYQLQYDGEGTVTGAESLVRWIHPVKGVVSPTVFIPVAESTGLIIDIGSWVLETALKQLSLWHKNPQTQEWTLSVNVSAKQFAAEGFVPLVEKMITEYVINPKKLKIELTESLLAKDTEMMIEKMKKLRNMGIQISIDDFGTGYASLQYLKSLPIDQIKIDQNFVFGMLKNKTDRIIVKTIIELSRAFDFEVVAEGVERKEDVEILKKLRCNYYQGYFFSKPEPIETIMQRYSDGL